MPIKRITAAVVAEMTPGTLTRDSEVRGFGIRYRARDLSYLVKTRINGRQRVLTIGRHGRGAWGPETARREAIRLLGMIRDGRDPAADRDQNKAAPDLTALSERYMTEYGRTHKKARTIVEDERLLKKHILPALGRCKARDIGRAEAARFHAGLRDTPVAANRALALLSAMFGWAEKVGERPDGTNPCRHIERYPEKGRERMLTPAELARLGDALDRSAQSWTDERKLAWHQDCDRQALEAGIPDREGRPGSRYACCAARPPRTGERLRRFAC
jgi:integrase